jgi:hypothetical protein
MAQTKFDPERWLETTTRALEDYVSNKFDEAVRDDLGNPAGLEVYEIVMEFPGPDLDTAKVPMAKTIIHFEIDDMPERLVGMGNNVFAENYDPATHTVREQEATRVRMSFDVGVWASDRSGGLTSRLRARQVLSTIFGATGARAAFRDATDGSDGGIAIINFEGGRFVPDQIGDIRVVRMVNCSLELEVFTRTPLRPNDPPAVSTIEEIVQAPGLTILG